MARSALQDRRCLVSGGAGAIGSNLVRALLDSGAKVGVIDNFSSGVKENLDGLLESIDLTEGSVSVEKDVEKAFEFDPEYVFHLAAHFANQNSVEHPVEDCLDNAMGTVLLLEASRKLKNFKRFIYASSSCVLGSQGGALSEDSPLAPETPYGISKLAGEHYTLFYHRVHRLPVAVVRYFNVFGPGEMPGIYRNVIPNMILCALEGNPLIITGTGEECREFVYVTDAVDATLLAALKQSAAGEVFHVGSGNVISIDSLAAAILEHTGSSSEIMYLPRREWDHILTRSTSSSKAHQLMGYQAQVPFLTGLKLTISWLRSRERLRQFEGAKPSTAPNLVATPKA